MNKTLKIGGYLEDTTGIYEIADIDPYHGYVYCKEVITDDAGNAVLDKIGRRLTIAEALKKVMR